MSIAELPHISITDPNGPWTRLEPSDVPADRALLSLNCEYNPGNVSTRKGFTQAFNPAEPVNAMYNWVFDSKNYLLYYNGTSGKVRLVPDLASPSPVDRYTISGAAGVQFASSGTRCYGAAFSSAGTGVDHGYVTTQYGAAIYDDKLFLGPLTTKPVITEPSAGSVTAGVHRVGYIVQTRSGFLGKISPVNSSTGIFDTTSTVTASGSKNLSVAIAVAPTITWPAEAEKVWPVMTTVANLNRYFIVPGVAPLAVSALGVTFTLDITDEDLASTGTDVTGQFNLLTQTSANVAPFYPFSVGEFGFRTVYLTEVSSGVTAGLAQAYVSEPERPQHITADQHVLYLPGQRKMTGQFALGKVLYICGPNWTYAFEDSGDVPVLWPSPRLVDGTIGIPAPRCATVSASQGFAVVAHQTGLWIFTGGAYQTKPLSYYVDPEWKRINWAGGAATVQVLDSKDKQQIYVFAPLDSATQPSHILMFDYSNGLSPEEVKFSLWNIASYTPGAGAIVQNATSNQLELWVGKSSSGKVLRQMGTADTNRYNDDSAGIAASYETALLPGIQDDPGRLYHHYGDQIRAVGSGTLSATVYGMDRTKNVSIAAITLAASPGGSYTRLYPRLRSESASIRFATSTANHWFQLSAVDHYYSAGPYKST